jgi:hypothetical protein
VSIRAELVSQMLAASLPCFSRSPSRASSAVTMAAELRTANVKRVGIERATFAGYDHPAGMTVSRFKTTFAREVGLDATTLEFYEVAADKLEVADAASVIPLADISAYGTKLSSLRTLDTDTWLLAMGDERAGE